MKRLEVFYKGYAEFFSRPNLWEAMAAALTDSATQLNLSKTDKENLNYVMVLNTIPDAYNYPPIKRSIAGHEKQLIQAHISALLKIKTFVEKQANSTASKTSPPASIRLVESALTLANNYIPAKAEAARKKISKF
jgi:hypothetical protein